MMITAGYVESMRVNIPVPEWVRTERIDYCDQDNTKDSGLLQFLEKVFHR